MEDVARPLATHFCRSLAHRRGVCSGRDCECGAWSDLYFAVLERIVGKPSLRGRPRQQGLLEQWAAQNVRPPFAQYVRQHARHGWMTHLLRAWNSARGLRVRMRPSADLRRKGWEGVALALDTAGISEGAEGFGITGETFEKVLEALWWDACQPAPMKVDVVRVSRHLAKQGEIPNSQLADEELYELGRVLEVIDLYIELEYPEWYSLFLAEPRRVTRPGSEFDERIDYKRKGHRRPTDLA